MAQGQAERLDDLGRAAGVVLVVLPPGVLQRQVGNGGAGDAEEVTSGGIAFAEDILEPVGAGSRRVSGELPDGPLVRSGPQSQLLGGEITERVEDEALVGRPALVEGLQS